MERYIVLIDGWSTERLAGHGWDIVESSDEFELYWNGEYYEHQIVSKQSPRTLILDDWADVQHMNVPAIQMIRSVP